MSNPANNGQVIGRLAQDIKEFQNSDGSKKQLITIAAENNFKSGPKKEIQTNFIQFENFVPVGRTSGGWDRAHKGDLIAVQYHVDAKPYTKDGVTEYPTKLVLDGFPTFLEPKSVTDKRAAQRTAKQDQGTPEPTAEAAAAAPEQDTAALERIAELEAELSYYEQEVESYKGNL